MTENRPQRMHLMLFPLFTGTHVGGWRHPRATPGRTHDIQFHIEIAQAAERAKFDAVFFADAQGFRTIVGRDAHSRNDVARLDPIVILSALAVVTRRIGLVATLSTSYNEPYAAARRLASVDHVSGGRAGWNVVTSTTRNEARNFGREVHFGHAERYARAEEFVDVVKALWDSWDDDAFVIDKASGRNFDPQKLHGLGHQGRFFKVAGPLTTARSPQAHPVLVQAGASDAGQALAARCADVVFTSHPTLESAQQFYREFKAKVAAAGRNPDECKILPSVQPLVAPSEAEARAAVDELRSYIHPEVAIGMLQLALGNVIDLRGYDPEGPLPPIPPTEGSKSRQAKVIAMSEGLSILELARRVATSETGSTLAGTPERVADELERWFRGQACDGFVVGPPYLPGSFDDFAAGVVPLLQARGLFRTEYDGLTLRDHLGLTRPPSRHEGHPERHVEPEIWHPD